MKKRKEISERYDFARDVYYTTLAQKYKEELMKIINRFKGRKSNILEKRLQKYVDRKEWEEQAKQTRSDSMAL